MLTAGQSTGTAGSSLEACLTALLHTCHALSQPQLAALLEPHVAAIWGTFFAAFEVFSRTCEQLSLACCVSKPSEPHPPPHLPGSWADDQHGSGQTAGQAAEDDDAASLSQSQEAGQSSSCKLLVLLSRCEHMEQLLAQLVPGFLAVLRCEDSPQVGWSMCDCP